MGSRLKLVILIFLLSLLSVNFTSSWIRGIFSGSIEFDSHGIPLYDGKYNPAIISQYALEKADSSEFLKIANWIVANIKYRNGFCVLEYDSPFSVYGLSPPWISGLANAEAMKVLLRAYELSDSVYLKKARLLLQSFTVSIDSGGVVLKEGPDRWWFAEYVREKPPMVLNGMMIVLLALYKFYEKTGDTLAISLFNKGLNSLCYHLSEFDFHGLSRYDLTGRIASPEYHELHLKLLQRLYHISGCKKLEEMRSRWQVGRVFLYRLVVHPDFGDLLVFGINFILVLGFVLLLRSKFFKK